MKLSDSVAENYYAKHSIFGSGQAGSSLKFTDVHTIVPVSAAGTAVPWGVRKGDSTIQRAARTLDEQWGDVNGNWRLGCYGRAACHAALYGAIIDIKVWQLQHRTAERPHGLIERQAAKQIAVLWDHVRADLALAA